MIITKLVITKGDGSIVREILFKKGLNLIVDNDPEGKGNNVGKTTMLRCIDYCLGSKGEDIYIDKESKTINTKIQNFLLENEIIFCLFLEDHQANELVLRRNFLQKKQRILEINGEYMTSLEAYKDRLSEIIFNNFSSSPSFRSLIGKFIRNDEHKMSNMLSFLHQSSTPALYQLVHLFLFGFKNIDALNTHSILIRDIALAKDQIRNMKRLSVFSDQNALQQSIIIYDSKIQEIDQQISAINIEGGNDSLLEEIKSIRNDVSEISLTLSKDNMDLTLHQKSKASLENELKILDKNYIKSIYEQANTYIPDLQKSYEEVLGFHNNIVQDRLSIVNTSLKELLDRIAMLTAHKNRLLKKEKSLIDLLGGEFDSDLEVLKQKKNEYYEEKGKILNMLSMLTELNEKIKSKTQQLEQVKGIIDLEIEALQNNIAIFNTYFTKYATQVCEKDLFISADFARNGFIKFATNNLPGNDGTGEKRSQIAVFDFAYVNFINEKGISGPRFVIHDNVEGKDDSHMTNVFNLANHFGGQYIVSVIKNRINSFLTDEEINLYSIVELNSQDKFFKID